ncbi:MAG: hypothetical protein DHS20C11_31160 [Lysobacteraceae bacterium]|nr:MAG: hypothetical protein DHS20C11_31160 [Xanthomonadaceae bacterium]
MLRLIAWSLALGLPAFGAQAGLLVDCPQPIEPETRASLRVASLNVAHGRDQNWNQLFVTKKRIGHNLQDIARLLNEQGVDVAALQEADGPSRWSGRIDHVRRIAEHSALSYSVHGLHAVSRMSQYGTALLANQALSSALSHRFEPSPPTKTKGFVQAVVTIGEGERQTEVTVVSVHMDFSRESVRTSQAREMITRLSSLSTPLIVAGDFNATWDDDTSAVRMLAEGLELSAFQPADPGMGTYKSIEGERLDWILISPQLQFLDYRVLNVEVSDHLPVVADIGLRQVD